MQTTHLLGAALVVLGLVACSSGTTGSGAGTGAATNPPVGGGGNGASGGNTVAADTGAGLAGVAPTAGGSATCDDACAHYLQCKGDGWDTTPNRSQCDQNCAALGVTGEQLASYVTLDCPTAIKVIEGSGPAPSTSGGTSGSSGSTDCNGCAWDGSSCIYLTGSGGNYFACASSCCGH